MHKQRIQNRNIYIGQESMRFFLNSVPRIRAYQIPRASARCEPAVVINDVKKRRFKG